jgi:hypothetical protein
MLVTGSTLHDVTRGQHSLSFAAIFIAGFAVVLALAVVGILFRLDWRSWLPGAEKRGSVVGSVTAAVYSFMSYFP